MGLLGKSWLLIHVIIINIIVIRQVSSGARRIIGGYEAMDGEFPFVVSIQTVADRKHFCCGSIISRDVVLTAAHCLTESPENMVVVAGNANIANTQGTVYKISETVIPSTYEEDTLMHDIGMIRVDRAFRFSTYVRPIRIQEDPFMAGQSNLSLMAIGWGSVTTLRGPSSNVLRFVNTESVPLEECSKAWNPISVDISIMCSKEDNAGLCAGDSGGPIVHGDYLIGLVSHLMYRCGGNIPAVSSNVAYFYDWINEYL